MQIKIPSCIPTDENKRRDILIEMDEGTTVDFVDPEKEEVIARFQPDELELILIMIKAINEKDKGRTP